MVIRYNSTSLSSPKVPPEEDSFLSRLDGLYDVCTPPIVRWISNFDRAMTYDPYWYGMGNALIHHECVDIDAVLYIEPDKTVSVRFVRSDRICGHLADTTVGLTIHRFGNLVWFNHVNPKIVSVDIVVSEPCNIEVGRYMESLFTDFAKVRKPSKPIPKITVCQ